MRRPLKAVSSVALVAALAVTAAACGSSSKKASTNTDSGGSVTAADCPVQALTNYDASKGRINVPIWYSLTGESKNALTEMAAVVQQEPEQGHRGAAARGQVLRRGAGQVPAGHPLEAAPGWRVHRGQQDADHGRQQDRGAGRGLHGGVRAEPGDGVPLGGGAELLHRPGRLLPRRDQRVGADPLLQQDALQEGRPRPEQATADARRDPHRRRGAEEGGRVEAVRVQARPVVPRGLARW